jgi:hypothetical protein
LNNHSIAAISHVEPEGQSIPIRHAQGVIAMSIKHAVRALGLILGFAVLAGTTAANQPLRDVTRVTEGLIAAGIAYEIGEVCNSLDARIVQGLVFLNGIKAHAQSLGYSSDEIDAYVNDRAEKDRLEAMARGRLADLGAVEGQADTYCAVGRDQIAAGTQIGHLLR